MRLIFLGSPPFAILPLQRLIKSPYKPVAIVTQPDRPKGRGREVEPSVVAKMAKSANIPCLQPASASDPAFLEEIKKLQPDLIAVVSYGQILKEEFLAIPKLGCFNLHASLLPKHRGASPINAAILSGDSETGVTVQRMVKKLDAGDIVTQASMQIDSRDTTGDLLDQLARLGSELLVETVEILESGDATFTPQDESKVSYAPKLKKESGKINWNQSAVDVDRQVRAMMPWPGAFTFLPGQRGTKRIAVLAGMPVAENSDQPAKKVIRSSPEGIDISCAPGIYRIKAVHPENARPMAIAQFLQGNPIAAGASISD